LVASVRRLDCRHLYYPLSATSGRCRTWAASGIPERCRSCETRSRRLDHRKDPRGLTTSPAKPVFVDLYPRPVATCSNR